MRLKEHVGATADTEVSVEGKATTGIAIPIKFKVFLSFENSDFLISTIDSIWFEHDYCEDILPL